jgi:hypothetical protein
MLDWWLAEVVVDVILVIFSRFDSIGKESIFEAFICVEVGMHRELGLLGIGAFQEGFDSFNNRISFVRKVIFNLLRLDSRI